MVVYSCYWTNQPLGAEKGPPVAEQQPADLDWCFIKVRQWLAAEGNYSDLIFERGLLEEDDLQTETMVVPAHYSVGQALYSFSSRKGE